MKRILTIAGSDCSGGAGIQADLKTIAAHGLYGMSVITALTAQNTIAVSAIHPIDDDFVKQQIDSVCTDIFPDSVKIGMLFSEDIICAVAQKITEYQMSSIVLDPVMISSSGKRLLGEDAVQALKKYLIPMVQWITPNLLETEVLCGFPVHNQKQMEQAAQQIAQWYPGVILIKGGHLTDTADDLLYFQGKGHWIAGKRIDNSNTHGTGCTLSTAIACALAQGLKPQQALIQAKQYLMNALRAQLNLGAGAGPINHMYRLSDMIAR